MNAERLLAHYERIAGAPNAIVHLRCFILDMAVRGKLVPQDPNDEPASELLKRIAAEKARLVNAGEIRKQEPLETVADADMIFRVPKTWEWVPATFPAYVVSDMDKKVQTKDVLASGDFPVVDQGKVFIRGYCNDPTKVIRVKAPLILFGDHTRETKLIDFDFVVGADGVKLLQPVCLFTRYYYLALQWLPLDSRGYGRHFKVLRASFIPLPPLAEQHRIVAKVDELMALCDQLEAARAEREATRDRLAAASLARLNAPNPDTFQDDARFALDALPALTTRPDQIKQFRQTILNLAVRGELLQQDSRDEPASKLLSKILNERRKRWESSQLEIYGASRKEPARNWREKYKRPPHEAGLYAIPNSWVWASALEVCDRVENGSTPPANDMFEGKGDVPFIKVYNLTKTGALDFSVKPTFIARATHERKLARSRIIPGDVLMNIVGPPLGKVSIVPSDYPEWNTNQAVVLFRPSFGISSKFLAMCLLSENVLSWITRTAQATVGQSNITVSNCRLLPIPLPPSAEQHRIVAKVDELMALCDRLEAGLATADDTRRRLLDALLHEALAPAEEREEAA